MALTLADIKARPRQEVVYTIECGGNHGTPVVHERHRHRQVSRYSARAAAEAGRRYGIGKALRKRCWCG